MKGMENAKAEGVVNITKIETNWKDVEEAGTHIANLARHIGEMLREMEADTGKAKELGLDIEEVIAANEKALHIGAAVCGIVAHIMQEDEDHE